MDRRAIEAVVAKLGGSFKGQKLDDVPLDAVARWLGMEADATPDLQALARRVRIAVVRTVEHDLHLTGEVRDGVTLGDLWEQLVVQERSRSRVAVDLGLDPKTVNTHFRDRVVPQVASALLRQIGDSSVEPPSTANAPTVNPEASPPVGPLLVDFAGEVHSVESRLTFGRNADLEVDDNRYLHRVLGEFFNDGALSWIRNLGSRIVLNLAVDDGHRATLPPGSSAALTPGTRGAVRFQAGRTRYEIEYACGYNPNLLARPVDLGGGSTTQFVVVLTAREVDYLITFAEPLVTGSGQPLPSYATVAEIWGVSQKTLDNTLQLWKQKLRSADLRTDAPLESLLTVMINHGLLTVEDLRWARLEGPSPRLAATGPRFSVVDAGETGDADPA